MEPQPGELIADGNRARDAIHVAIAPVTAAVLLQPGEHVGLLQPDNIELVAPGENNIGIIDPFLIQPVQPKERCWMFLYPGTITSLRHIWSHPAYQQAHAAALRKTS